MSYKTLQFTTSKINNLYIYCLLTLSSLTSMTSARELDLIGFKIWSDARRKLKTLELRELINISWLMKYVYLYTKLGIDIVQMQRL